MILPITPAFALFVGALPLAFAQSTSTAAPRPSTSMATVVTTNTAVRSSAAVVSSAVASVTAAPSLVMVAVPTLTACSTYEFQWALRNVVPASYTMTLSVNNIGMDQSIVPSGTSAPLPSITSARSAVQGYDPRTVTASSSAARTSNAVNAITTTSAPSSIRAAPSSATTTAISRNAALTARDAPAPVAPRALNRRTDIPINGTLGTGTAAVAYRFAGNLPEGNYLLTLYVSELNIQQSQRITVVEPDMGDFTCLSPWNAILADSGSSPSSGGSSTRSGTSSARPSGSLADSTASSSGSGASGGMIAGIVVGAIAALVLLGLLAFCCVRRRRQRRDRVFGEFDFHKNDRDRVNLDEYRGEKLGSAGASPDATWGTGVGMGMSGQAASPTGSNTSGHGHGRAMMPMPLGMIPRSQRGSIDSISAKSVNLGSGENGGGYPPTSDRSAGGMPQLPPVAVLGSSSGHTTPRRPTHGQNGHIDPFAQSTPKNTAGRDRRFDDGRRQSSPPVSPSGYMATSQPFHPDAISQAFSRRAGDRSSGLASDTAAGRRPSPPTFDMSELGKGTPSTGTGAGGVEPVQRKGSVKRKPVPSLGPALRKELSESGLQSMHSRSRQGSESGGRQEFVIVPDMPRGQ